MAAHMAAHQSMAIHGTKKIWIPSARKSSGTTPWNNLEGRCRISELASLRMSSKYSSSDLKGRRFSTCGVKVQSRQVVKAAEQTQHPPEHVELVGTPIIQPFWEAFSGNSCKAPMESLQIGADLPTVFPTISHRMSHRTLGALGALGAVAIDYHLQLLLHR